MRLSKNEIEAIKRVARDVWGRQTIVSLFGSRTDDTKKGGDIDLYIHSVEEQDSKQIMIKKAEFPAKMEILLGEQKIDVLVGTHHNSHLSIIKTAQRKGIEL